MNLLTLSLKDNIINIIIMYTKSTFDSLKVLFTEISLILIGTKLPD